MQSICDYLANPPSGCYIDIYDNAPGCNSQQEVEAACDSITTVAEIYPEETFTIFQNPCSGSTKLEFTICDQTFVSLDLYEMSGVKIKRLLNKIEMPGTYEMEINLNYLKAGVYFFTLQTNKGIQTTKIIKL